MTASNGNNPFKQSRRPDVSLVFPNGFSGSDFPRNCQHRWFFQTQNSTRNPKPDSTFGFRQLSQESHKCRNER